MNKQKISNLLGLAQRAGRIISGEELVVKAIQDGKAKLVFLAHDAGPNLTKKIQDKSHYYQVENCKPVFSTLELSIAVGKSRKVLAVTDAGFTKKIEVSYGIEEEDMICLRKDCTKSQKNLEKKVKEVVARAKELGLDVKSHSSSVEEAVAAKIAASFKPAAAPKAEAKPAAPKSKCRKRKQKKPVFS